MRGHVRRRTLEKASNAQTTATSPPSGALPQGRTVAQAGPCVHGLAADRPGIVIPRPGAPRSGPAERHDLRSGAASSGRSCPLHRADGRRKFGLEQQKGRPNTISTGRHVISTSRFQGESDSENLSFDLVARTFRHNRVLMTPAIAAPPRPHSPEGIRRASLNRGRMKLSRPARVQARRRASARCDNARNRGYWMRCSRGMRAGAAGQHQTNERSQAKRAAQSTHSFTLVSGSST